MIDYWVPKRGLEFKDYINNNAQCLDGSKVFIQSDRLAQKFSELLFTFDYCYDIGPEGISDDCWDYTDMAWRLTEWEEGVASFFI